ncbi:uncharacterized protein [Amphiura filiformis]|uniref:uncharacterized protein n=1 Tax=Amphiura filiformis TaxID=82378 RepID=UPI003B21D2D4
MDVFTQLGDAVGDLYSTSYTSEHSLHSPDLSIYAASPQSIFMYEHDNEPIPLTKSSTESINVRGASGNHGNPLFDTPWSEEMTDLGCSLGNSFMSESSLCGSSLNDSVKDVWDFAAYDDVSSPLQHPDDDFLHSPTLAELNMEDSTQTYDVLHGGAVRQSAFTQHQPLHHQKTKPVLIKQTSHRHRTHDTASSLRKVHASGISHDRYSSLFTMSKSHPTPLNSHQQHQPSSLSPQSHSLQTLVKTECTTARKTNSTKSSSLPSSSSNCLSFSNLLGRRTRTFTSSPSNQKINTRLWVDRKWEEIKSFIHQEKMAIKVKQEQEESEDEAVSSPTKLTFKRHAHGYTVKNEKIDLSRSHHTDDGFDSHDEGLGSEQDMEEGSDDEGGDDIGTILEEDESDASDAEDEETGMSASSIPAPAGKYKSRRSEYDDMTPNPRKLLHIGNELRKLNKIISDMAPVSELTGSARNRCRKEKNKLAHRACRLKKKAQHEANKIKLSGLEDEHTRLMFVLTAIKKDMVQQVQKEDTKSSCTLNQKLDNLIKTNLGQMVAEHTNEYVNLVMERTAREKSDPKPKGS